MFYAVELTTFMPGTAAITYALGHGTHPHGALARLPDAAQASGLILASDVGYRTAPTDPGGPVPYPPLLADAFQIDRRLNLDPAASSVAAAWGTINLSNATGAFDAIAGSWNSDGRQVRILSGTKSIENFAGPVTLRATSGTYVDPTGTLQTAAPGVVRWDYSTGSAVALNQPIGTNLFTNSETFSSFAAAGSANQVWAATGDVNPKGTAAAWKLTASVANTLTTAVRYISAVTGGATVTHSLFAKTFGVNEFVIACWGGSSLGGGYPTATYHLDTGTITAISAGATARMNQLGNAWWRCEFTYPLTTTAISPAIRLLAADVTTTLIGVLFWGDQCEEAALASSYIATAGATVTRAADNLTYARGIELDPAYATLTPIFVGMATPWTLSDTQLQVPIRDATYWLERPLQTTQFAGSGGYEGTVDLTGQPKPKARGGTASAPIHNISPVLIDPVALIYQYTDGPGTVVAAYEGGAAVWTPGADVADLYVGSTAGGTYRTSNARGMFQLGATPQRTVTADVTGVFPIAGAITGAAAIARYLLTEDLQLPAGNIDTASFTITAAAPAADFGHGTHPHGALTLAASSYVQPDPAAGIAGVYFAPNDSPDGATALDRVVSSFGGKVIPTRAGTLRLVLLRALPATAAPVAQFDMTNLISLTPQALPTTVTPPPYRFRVAYSHNYTVESSGVSPSATAAMQVFVAAADRYGGFSSNAVLSAYRRPNDSAPVGGALLQYGDAQNTAANLGALWSTWRQLYSAVLPVAVALPREIGDVVTVKYPLGALRNGALGQIVGEQFHSADSTITYNVLV